LALEGDESPALGRFFRLRSWDGTPLLGGPLLDRPFSVFKSSPGKLEFLIRPVGVGSFVLSQIAPGDTVTALGPLGRGLDQACPQYERHCWYLVAGGVGLAPFGEFSHWLPEKALVFYGERRTDLWLEAEDLLSWLDVVKVAEDGPGPCRVTAPLEALLDKSPRPVFACGPAPMLAAAAALARRFSVPYYACVEAPLACGLGACLSCAIPKAGGGYLRACTEGPVVDGSLIDWEAFK
jgi:dihydroorotate dehydrogenase electron transfer subunit